MRVLFTADALRQFKKLPRVVRPFLKEAIRTHLIEADPAETNRNKFRLRRASAYADYELRAGDWRIFYRVLGDDVTVTLLGEKRGHTLIVEGEELEL